MTAKHEPKRLTTSKGDQRMSKQRKGGNHNPAAAEPLCWKCGAPALTDQACVLLRRAARRAILRLLDRRPEDEFIMPAVGVPLDGDQRIAQRLLEGRRVNEIMDELQQPPTQIIPSLLRLALLPKGGAQ